MASDSVGEVGEAFKRQTLEDSIRNLNDKVRLAPRCARSSQLHPCAQRNGSPPAFAFPCPACCPRSSFHRVRAPARASVGVGLRPRRAL